MLRKILVYIGGALTLLWGISHLIPTENVIRGFGTMSADNTSILRMEWMNEGFTLIFIGLLAITVTVFAKTRTRAVKMVYLLSFLMLLAMAILSLFTGFKVDFLPYRLCPFIFTLSGILILQRAFGCDKDASREKS